MIEINNLTTNPIEEEFLKKVAKIILVGEKKEKANLSIALVGQGRIRALNKKYRGKNRVTDILAFPGNGLGEVVICLREVKKMPKG
jgi:probable rRNA maturation factor